MVMKSEINLVYQPLFILIFGIQVGDSDQKLAEGITLYSIAADRYERSAILGPLIEVSLLFWEERGGSSCVL